MRALTFVAALCVIVAAGCGGGTGEDSAAPSTTAISSNPSSRPPAPTIEGVSLEGERIALADLRGRPVLVNVWSSW